MPDSVSVLFSNLHNVNRKRQEAKDFLCRAFLPLIFCLINLL